tara:strand:+ start:89 stop:574 length:486 start_codon:yes stop_codon:yes gene_type:complete
MFNPRTFGFINGNITILSIIVGLYSAGASKREILSAILAMLIADPLCDAYALYFSEKETQKHDTSVKSKSSHTISTLTPKSIGMNAFISQFIVQFIFLMMFIFASNAKQATYMSLVFSTTSILGYGIYQNISIANNIKNILSVLALITITYFSEKVLAKMV